MPDSTLVLVENVLQLVGAFIVFSVSLVAYRGYTETKSPTMLRITAAFFFLGLSFSLMGVAGLVGGVSLQTLTLGISAMAIVAGLMEAMGYFFLAFSHMIDVRISSRIPNITISSVLFIPGLSVAAVLKTISFYFLSYGVAETVIAFRKNRSTTTLLIALGLALIATAEFMRWLNFFYPTAIGLIILSLVVKIIGFSSLYIPVLHFSLRRGAVQV